MSKFVFQQVLRCCEAVRVAENHSEVGSSRGKFSDRPISRTADQRYCAEILKAGKCTIFRWSWSKKRITNIVLSYLRRNCQVSASLAALTLVHLFDTLAASTLEILGCVNFFTRLSTANNTVYITKTVLRKKVKSIFFCLNVVEAWTGNCHRFSTIS